MQAPSNEKNLQIESKLIQVIQWKDKRKKERDQYDLKQPFNSKLLTFYWTSSPRCLRTPQGSCAGSLGMAHGPQMGCFSYPEVPQQDVAEDWALSASARMWQDSGLPEIPRESLQFLDLFTHVHGHHPLYACLTLGFHKDLWELPARLNAGF